MDLRPALLELMDTGLSQAEIARKIGLSRATVNSVARGNNPWEPRYGAGMKLMRLYKQSIVNATSQRSGRTHPATNSNPAD